MGNFCLTSKCVGGGGGGGEWAGSSMHGCQEAIVGSIVGC